MKDSTIQLSRGHLFALGSMSVALAALAFFLGFTVSERVRPADETAPGVPPLVAEEVRAGSLEALLARVADQQAADLVFPAELESTDRTVSANGVPTGGWAIQVAEYPDRESADRLVEQLRATSLTAYRVAAIVGGSRVQRVRVSGFNTREAAMAEVNSVGARAGSTGAMVVAAP